MKYTKEERKLKEDVLQAYIAIYQNPNTILDMKRRIEDIVCDFYRPALMTITKNSKRSLNEMNSYFFFAVRKALNTYETTKNCTFSTWLIWQLRGQFSQYILYEKYNGKVYLQKDHVEDPCEVADNPVKLNHYWAKQIWRPESVDFFDENGSAAYIGVIDDQTLSKDQKEMMKILDEYEMSDWKDYGYTKQTGHKNMNTYFYNKLAPYFSEEKLELLRKKYKGNLRNAQLVA